MLKSDSLNELAKSLCLAQAAFKPAKKDAKNPFFKSQYADFESIVFSTREALTSNNLCVIQTTRFELEKTVLVTTLLHSSGQYVSGEYPISAPVGDAQKMGSAMTYAKRYTYSAIVGVVTSDDDAESTYSRPKSENQDTAHTAHKDYVIPLGEFKGKKLAEVDKEQLSSYYNSLLPMAKKFTTQQDQMMMRIANFLMG